MQDIWIESFYNEIDAEKRQAFLRNIQEIRRMNWMNSERNSGLPGMANENQRMMHLWAI